MPTSDLSFVSLILNASVVVQLVMAILVLASVLSWTIIFDRSRVLKKARREVDHFEDRFWSGGDLGDLYRAVDRDRETLRGASAIFHAGFREFARLRENAAVEPLALVEGARRAMRVALSREIDTLENSISELETRLSDPAFYNGDHEKVQTTATELDRLQSELDQRMERWTELTDLAEAYERYRAGQRS